MHTCSTSNSLFINKSDASYLNLIISSAESQSVHISPSLVLSLTSHHIHKSTSAVSRNILLALGWGVDSNPYTQLIANEVRDGEQGEGEGGQERGDEEEKRITSHCSASTSLKKWMTSFFLI